MENNSYSQKYPEQYEQILSIINKNVHGYFKFIANNTKLNLFLSQLFPQLVNNNIATKCNWLLHDIHAFPKCQHCEKEFIQNVSIMYQYPKYCGKCNRIYNKQLILKRLKTFKRHCQENENFLKNISEKSKQTKIQRYGNENYNNISKMKNTKQQRYGNEYFVNQDKTKQTKFEKYGNNVYVNIEKRKKTCLKRYGCENTFQVDKVKNKIEQTNLKKYGKTNVFQVNEIKEKIKQTNILKYGTENVFSSERIKDKIKKTNIEKYGFESPMQNSEVCKKSKEKYKLVCLKRYKSTSYLASDQFKQFCIKKFKCENPMQNNKIRKLAQTKYNFYEIHFDSAPELAYYIWLTDNNISFEYQPNISLEYKYEGKKHIYMPDFKVEDQLVELKGSQFLKEDGSWKNPYDSNQDALYEAKHQCLLNNNVKILYEEDYKQYLSYIENKYGKNYLTLFKNKKDVTCE